LQDDDRSSRPVVGSIKPISVTEFSIAVRLVERVVVEVIDGYGEVVFGVEKGRVGVIPFEEVSMADGASLDIGSAQLVLMIGIWGSDLTPTFLSSALSGNAANAKLTSPRRVQSALSLTMVRELERDSTNRLKSLHLVSEMAP
jgi:glucose-6-phosphate isomerase